MDEKVRALSGVANKYNIKPYIKGTTKWRLPLENKEMPLFCDTLVFNPGAH